ncbi:MAG: hypothetical protein KDD70_16420, partial [Bdellovibrionales bacterium]|nr:hypothetical protein [Bdellovibrionales bacterium]
VRFEEYLQQVEDEIRSAMLSEIAGKQLKPKEGEMLAASQEHLERLQQVHLSADKLRRSFGQFAVHMIAGRIIPLDSMNASLVNFPSSISTAEFTVCSPEALAKHSVRNLSWLIEKTGEATRKKDALFGTTIGIDSSHHDLQIALRHFTATIADYFKGSQEHLSDRLTGKTDRAKSLSILEAKDWDIEAVRQISAIALGHQERVAIAKSENDGASEEIRAHGLVSEQYTIEKLRAILDAGGKIAIVEDRNCPPGEAVQAFSIYYPPGSKLPPDANRLAGLYSGANLTVVDLYAKRPEVRGSEVLPYLFGAVFGDLNLSTDTDHAIGELHPDNVPSLGTIMKFGFALDIFGRDEVGTYHGTPALAPVRADLRAAHQELSKEAKSELLQRWAEESARLSAQVPSLSTAHGGLTIAQAIQRILSVEDAPFLRLTGPSGSMVKADELRLTRLFDDLQNILDENGEVLCGTLSWGATTMMNRKVVNGADVYSTRRRGIDRTAQTLIKQHPGIRPLGVVSLAANKVREVQNPTLFHGTLAGEKSAIQIGSEDWVDKETGEVERGFFATFEDAEVPYRVRFITRDSAEEKAPWLAEYERRTGISTPPVWYQEFIMTYFLIEAAAQEAEKLHGQGAEDEENGQALRFGTLVAAGGGTVGAEIEYAVGSKSRVGLISGCSENTASHKYLERPEYAEWREANREFITRIDTGRDLYNYLSDLGLIRPKLQVEEIVSLENALAQFAELS